MFKKLLMLLILGTIPISNFCFSQEPNNADKPNFSFASDFTQFRYSDSLSYFEFSIDIFRNQLKFVPDEDKGFKGEFFVNASILKDDSLFSQKVMKNINHVDSLSEITGANRLFAQNSFALPSGEFKLKLVVFDFNDKTQIDSTIIPITIKNYAKNSLALSDIQCATLIKQDTGQSTFNKNGFLIYPNPSRVYGISSPLLYTYSEIYNLVPSTLDSTNKYSVTYKILNNDNQVVKDFTPKIKTKPGTSAVEVNGINVVTLVSGPYNLNIEIKDFETGNITSSNLKFYVFRQGDYEKKSDLAAQTQNKVGSAGIDAHKYNTMSEDQLDQEYEWVLYICQKEEKETFKTLNEDGKRIFLKEFWSKRDPTPGTPINEYKKDYLNRVEFANRRFKGNFKDGYKTDRGRVMLIYGQPDEVERHQYSSENRTYEVWYYHALQGGVSFIFVDKREMGDMDLVNSSARGEIYDTNWERWIDPIN